MSQLSVVKEILEERAAQDRKWGEQNWPDFDQVLLTRPGGCTPQRMAEHYEIPTAGRARFLCENAAHWKQLTFGHILIEEIGEAFGECNAPVEVLRAELVQCAAVTLAWIEAIDRRVGMTNSEPPQPEE